MSTTRPSSRDDFEIAIVCALPLEYNAVSLAFDEFWDHDGGHYGKADGDPNTYLTGRIGKFNVAMALLPRSGKVNAAGAAVSLRFSYKNIQLALLVGICGAVPRAGNDEILLGDVVIAKSIIEFDYGEYPDKFTRKRTEQDLTKPNKDISNLLMSFETCHGSQLLHEKTAHFLKELQRKAGPSFGSDYTYLGWREDILFGPTYRHKHRGTPACICKDCHGRLDPVCDEALVASCHDLQCDERYQVSRERLELKQQSDDDEIQNPKIFLGPVASGDTVLKSGEDRDRIAKDEGVIAFEMEGAGIWEDVPTILVKGACDYADCHKSKKWQKYAAITAASAAKAILERCIRRDKTTGKVLDRGE
ncbi:hypothetical protein F66182_935 [Fusarium sp. NRRL 66182]|nr:hypothetical protein F66182_935 [Fusarium sp. NRRL 66182]